MNSDDIVSAHVSYGLTATTALPNFLSLAFSLRLVPLEPPHGVTLVLDRAALGSPNYWEGHASNVNYGTEVG